MIEQGQKGKHAEFLYISATNAGHRTANITNVGWKIGFWKKRYAVQVVSKDLYSSGVPVKINDGEEAKWFIPLELEDNWIQRFSRDFLIPHPRKNLLGLRIQIFTSIGKTFEARIENNLKEILMAECSRQLEAKR